ncbi:MAG: chloride channel protein [Candidatus Saccharimonadales bacterium]
MNKLRLLVGTIIVAIGVALTYHYFEAVVADSITYIWDTLLNTANRRLLVIPAAVLLGLIFFAVQHWLDAKSEKGVSEGLGNTPKPTAANFAKVLFIGYLSLVAGASLGPEAILVPASLVLGAYVASKLFRGDAKMATLLGGAGFAALFTAFFGSFFVGFLSVFLIAKTTKRKVSLEQLAVAAVSAAVAIVSLHLLEAKVYIAIPEAHWQMNRVTLLMLPILCVVGFGLVFLIAGMQRLMSGPHKLIAKQSWWLRGLVASVGLAGLYLLGGSLVEFTGNKSIVPMFEQAADLGLIGLLVVMLVKLLAISWSKVMGYRGGLIFPTIFVAAVVVAIGQIYSHDLNILYGITAVMVGVIAANNKTAVLF